MGVLVNHLYRHYKGNYYWVEEIATHTETEERLVVYREVKRSKTKDLMFQSKIWARPENMFLENLEIDSEVVLRFSPIGSIDELPFTDE